MPGEQALMYAVPYVNSVLQQSQQNQNNQEAMQFQMQQNELAYQRSFEMWNRSNEYNSPKNQMQRYREAGLNPNLIYGNISSGNAAQVAPQYRPVEGHFQKEAVQLPNVIDLFQNYEMKQIQIDRLRKLNEVTDIEKWIKSATEQYLSNRNIYLWGTKENWPIDQKGLYDYEYEIKKAQLDNLKQNLANKLTNQGLTQSQADWLENKVKIFKETGVNIDRDEMQWRILAEILSKLIPGGINNIPKLNLKNN